MYNKFEDLIDLFKGKSIYRKIAIAVIAIILLVVYYYLCCWFVGSIMFIFNDQTHSKIWYGLHKYSSFTKILYLLTTAIIIISIVRNGKANLTRYKDERGVFYMEKGTHGTSHYATEEEINKYFNVSSIDDASDMIFGQLTDKGKKVVTYKRKEKGASGTRHVIALAGSGLGKSHNLVLPNLLQCVKRGHSFIVTDPSTELYRKTGQYCRNKGLDVKLLNLANLDYSEYWNCLQEVISEETGRIDTNRLQSFVQIYMRNSAVGENQDYWYQCAQNLIEATIGYVGYKRESWILERYKEIYTSLTGEVDSKFSETIDNYYVPFPWCENQLLDVAEKLKADTKEIKKIFKEIKASAPKLNIEEVYNAINNIKTLTDKDGDHFKKMPKFTPGRAAYDRFKATSKDAVVEGAISGAQFKFKIFDEPRLRNILSHDGINFKTINKRQSAYYVAISDTDDALKPIASLFFSFFYKDAQENYDLEENLRVKENRRNTCIPTMAMLDEFSSLGVITGSESLWGTIMSDCRKREIYNFIIVQYYSQLEGTYGKYVRDGIISGCQTILFLGGNDPGTLEFISKKTGIATVMADSHKEVSNPLGHNTTLVNNEMSVGTTKRQLLTEDEAGKVEDKVLVIKEQCSPFFCNLFQWTEHPAYQNGECEEVSYFESVKFTGEDYLNVIKLDDVANFEIGQTKQKEDEPKKESADTRIDKMIKQINSEKPLSAEKLFGKKEETENEIKEKYEQTKLMPNPAVRKPNAQTKPKRLNKEKTETILNQRNNYNNSSLDD